ncbi:MAG: YggT family protein [Anaerolineaceae bacterium]|jgi:YggT family protein
MTIINLAIQIVIQIITFVVIAQAISTFFLPPGNPVRDKLDQLVNPVLNPIRRIVPTIGNFDFSPVILIILLQVIEYFLLRLTTL